MSGAERRAVLLVVRGRVQGVGFRQFTRRQALELGLVGWVRNREDGTVEVAAAGRADALAALRHILGKGPMAADVRGIEESEPPELLLQAANWNSFEIDR